MIEDEEEDEDGEDQGREIQLPDIASEAKQSPSLNGEKAGGGA